MSRVKNEDGVPHDVKKRVPPVDIKREETRPKKRAARVHPAPPLDVDAECPLYNGYICSLCGDSICAQCGTKFNSQDCRCHVCDGDVLKLLKSCSGCKVFYLCGCASHSDCEPSLACSLPQKVRSYIEAMCDEDGQNERAALEKSIEIPVVTMAATNDNHTCCVCGESECFDCLTKDIFVDSKCSSCNGDNLLKLPLSVCGACSKLPDEEDASNNWRAHLIGELMERVSLEHGYQGRGRRKTWISLKAGKPVSSTELLFAIEIYDAIKGAERSWWPESWLNSLELSGFNREERPMFSADRIREIEKHFFALKCTYVSPRIIIKRFE